MFGKLFAAAVCILLVATSHAQNVGIGTTNPHSSAALQVSSTSRGFLPPRLNGVQRISIVSPLNGLMVYDTDSERMYVYQDGVWRFLLNNELWVNNATSVYQASLNVGIGNANPTEKLHVTGNIRLTGEVMTGTGMTINNSSGTLTFQSAGVDKGFVQLSGDNLRLGTHSSNTEGKMVIRTGGSDNIFIASNGYMGLNIAEPLARLDLNGNMRISGKMQTSTTGASHMLPVAFGLIQANAIVSTGSSGNFSANRMAEGHYRLISDDFNANSVIIATCTGTGVTISASQGPSANMLDVYIRWASDGTAVNAWFNFVAFTR